MRSNSRSHKTILLPTKKSRYSKQEERRRNFLNTTIKCLGLSGREKACACYRQIVPTGSGISRGSSSNLGVVSTLGGTWPSLGRRPGQKDLHLREDASTAPADVLAKLQRLLPHLPRPGKPPSSGPTKSLSEPTPLLSTLTPLPPAPAHRREAEGPKN